MNLQRYEQKVGYARLDSVIDTLGDRGLMSLIVDKLSNGIPPSDIAADLGVPFMILWEWLEADPKRQSLYDEGWRMYATTLHAETVRIADMATPEDVGVAKLRVDTRFKAASNYDKKRFGAQQQTAGGGFAGGVVINISAIELPGIKAEGNVMKITSPITVEQAEDV